jgi:uncharacterized repeat protein (TIGR03803 family)
VTNAAFPAAVPVTRTMKLKRQPRVVLTLATLIAIVLLGNAAAAQTYRVIHDFGQGCPSAWRPVGLPAVAKNGDLYGVTSGGGGCNGSAIYKLTAPRSRDGAWTETVLYEYNGNAEYPSSLVIGEDGALYGTGAGPNIRGFIFRLTPPNSGDGPWTYQTLYTFQSSSDGIAPQGNLIFDAKGNLYGAAGIGGDLGCGYDGGCGTVFELKRPGEEGRKWRFSVLHTFTGTPDGAQPYAGLTFDHDGNLYGTASAGGSFGDGAVYRLTRPKTKGRDWTETVLQSFDRQDNGGYSPGGPVVFDSSGNLYGPTYGGGDPTCQGGFGCGVAFELSPPAKKGGAWTYAALHAFQGGSDGISPSGCVVFDGRGNLYGTTQTGGEASGGTVYRLAPPARKGGAWTETVLHAFGSDGDGAVPASGLTWGKWNYLYGVTGEGGSACQGLGCGTAFELRP